MKVALHTCCGPCASACVPRLKELGHEVTMVFANSNISSEEEFEKRREAAETLAKAEGVALEVLPYDHAAWLKNVAVGYEQEPEKGERCRRCFRYNLGKTAAFAKSRGFEAFTTSLTVSPHKVSAMVFEAGRVAATEVEGGRLKVEQRNLPVFLEEDFKKREGFKCSLKRSEELGLYRQSWCGCEFGIARTRDYAGPGLGTKDGASPAPQGVRK